MCDVCHSGEPAVHVELRHNVGMLVMRRVYSTDGRLCSACLGRAFGKHQLGNLFLGWWGTISFVMTFVFLIENTRAYLAARKDLRRMLAHRQATRFVPQGSASERLAPFRHNVRIRLRGGEDASQVAADLARLHEVPLTDATEFVAGVAAE